MTAPAHSNWQFQRKSTSSNDCLGDSHIHSFTRSFTNSCLISAASNSNCRI